MTGNPLRWLAVVVVTALVWWGVTRYLDKKYPLRPE